MHKKIVFVVLCSTGLQGFDSALPLSCESTARKYVYRPGVATFSTQSFNDRSTASLFDSRYHGHMHTMDLPDTTPSVGKAVEMNVPPTLKFISKMRKLQLAGDEEGLLQTISAMGNKCGNRAKTKKKLAKSIYREKMTKVFKKINYGTKRDAQEAIEELKRLSPYCRRQERDFFECTVPQDEESLRIFGIRAAHYREAYGVELLTHAQEIYEARFATDFEIERMTKELKEDLQKCADNELKKDMVHRFMKRLIMKFCDPKQIAYDFAHHCYSEAMEKLELLMIIVSDDVSVKIEWIENQIIYKYNTLKEFYEMSVEERTDFLADLAYDKILGKGVGFVEDHLCSALPKIMGTKEKMTMRGIAQKGSVSKWKNYNKKYLTIMNASEYEIARDFARLCPQNIVHTCKKNTRIFTGDISAGIKVSIRDWCNKSGGPVMEFRNAHNNLLFKIRYKKGE